MSRQNLYYFTNYFPDSKARHVQIAKMVDSFINTHSNVKFVLRDYRSNFHSDPKDFYNLKNTFEITELSSLKLLPIKYDFYFHYNLRKYVDEIIKSDEEQKTILYSRYGKNSGRLTEILIESAGKNNFRGVFAEIHEGLDSREESYATKLDGIVVISKALRNMLLDLGIDDRKILVAPSCVDVDSYIQHRSKSKSEMREELSLPVEKNLAVYTGHLYRDRGVETLVESARFLDDRTEILIVGGLPEDVRRVEKLVHGSGLADSVSVLGSRPSSAIPLYQLCADVLVMPYPENWKLKQWSSPMKMFEYMATSRPIVASDFPVVREVLDGKNSYLVKPGDPAELAEGINKCIRDKTFSDSICTKAFEDVKDYTWDRRAEKILEFMMRIKQS